jgi:hypothetical protein
MTLEEVILKNTNPDSVATALAKRVLPVPKKIMNKIMRRITLS